MKIILKYFIIVLLINPISGIAQDSTWTRGIRLGCDLSRFALPLTQPNRKAAVEFSIDVQWKPRYFATGELGFENVKISNEHLDYSSNSIYGRIGYDKNILKHDEPRFKDMFFFGYRYGLALVRQEVTSYTISSIYGNLSNSLPPQAIFHHWVELVGGTRVSFANTVFLGFSGRLRVKLYSQKDINYPYVIPGFGDGSKKVVLGFNYSIYFQIPVKKVKIKKQDTSI